MFFTIMVIASLALEIVFYLITARTLKDQMGRKCLGIAISVATLFENDTDSLKEYIETLDTESDYYRKTKAEMEKIRFGNEDNIAFLYVETRTSESEMQYLFDGEIPGTPTFAPPGMVDPLTPTRIVCYETGRPHIGDFVQTVWGNLLSAYAPIYDASTGELLAIVGTDVSIEQYNAIMKNQIFIILFNTVVFALLALVLLLTSSSSIEKKLYKDSLTGVFSRGYFMNFLKFQLKSIKRRDYPVAVFIADVDHFKDVNDTYGHPFGDRVLFNICNVINSYMRKTDCFARYGGEEFAGIMPGLSMENAYKVIMRIHDAVGETVTSDESLGINAKVTISIGVSQLNKYETAEEALKKADVALYAAKKERNKVVCAQPKGKEL
jgi:diguanylate cyclase (GGDEF)-like protein